MSESCRHGVRNAPACHVFGAPHSTAALLRAHVPILGQGAGLLIRVYAAWIWARFAIEKLEQGWLTSNPLEPLLRLVADGHLPVRMPGYDVLIRWVLELRADVLLAPVLPVLELAIAIALLVGLRIRLVAAMASVVNLNLLMSGIGSVAIDGRLLVIQIALLVVGSSGSGPTILALGAGIQRMIAARSPRGACVAHG